MTRGGLALELRDVQAERHDGTPVLRDVSFQVTRGERVALLGANGAGKSSLFLAAGGFLPFLGRIAILGVDLTAASLPSIRARMGFLFENADDQLFLDTVGDDVAFGPRAAGLGEAEVATRVHDALEAVGLPGLEPRSPKRLSLGERRLVALATVLAMRPEVLLLDELTANLDARSRRRVLGAVDRYGGTVLLLTHDLDAAARSTDRSIVLAEGRVVADLPTRDVASDRRVRLALGLDEGERPSRHHAPSAP